MVTQSLPLSAPNTSAMLNSSSNSPSCIFLFDMARSRSHLFFRYISTHPKVQPMWHPFLPAFLFGPERFTLKTKNAREGEWVEPPADGGPTYAEADETFLEAIEAARKEEKVFVANEHSQMVLKQDITLPLLRSQPLPQTSIPGSNPTVIPDHIISNKTFQPIFIVRHPVFRIPSTYESFAKASAIRPGEEDWIAITDLRFQRLVFDYFRNHTDKTPIVVDGDDVVWRTEELRQGLGKALGLDPQGFKDVWDPVPEGERSKWPVIRYFLETIDASTGVQRGSEGPPDADVEKAEERWVESYGMEVAGQLRKTVDDCMPDYEYMRQFKI